MRTSLASILLLLYSTTSSPIYSMSQLGSGKIGSLLALDNGNRVLSYQILGNQNSPLKVCMIAGYGSTMFKWKPIINSYNLNTHQFLILDNRGTGLSTNGASQIGGYTIEGMADDARKLLYSLGWTQSPIILVGWSMGGMIALKLSLVLPANSISSLILISTCAKYTTTTGNGGLAGLLWRMALSSASDEASTNEVAEENYTRSWLRQYDSRFTINNYARFREQLSLYQVETNQSPETGFAQGLAILNHFVSPEQLEVIDNQISRIVIMAGRQDRVVDPGCSEDLNKYMPKSLLILVDDRGHDLVFASDLLIIDQINLALDQVLA